MFDVRSSCVKRAENWCFISKNDILCEVPTRAAWRADIEWRSFPNLGLLAFSGSPVCVSASMLQNPDVRGQQLSSRVSVTHFCGLLFLNTGKHQVIALELFYGPSGSSQSVLWKVQCEVLWWLSLCSRRTRQFKVMWAPSSCWGNE